MAVYYFGVGTNTSKKTGNPFWFVDLLRQNRYGNWELKPLFCCEEVYKRVQSRGFKIGASVAATVGLDLELTDLVQDPHSKDLNIQ